MSRDQSVKYVFTDIGKEWLRSDDWGGGWRPQTGLVEKDFQKWAREHRSRPISREKVFLDLGVSGLRTLDFLSYAMVLERIEEG